MFSILALLGTLLGANTASGFEVFTAATANFSNKIEDQDYGDQQFTGGNITAVGIFEPAATAYGFPLELRLQRTFQSTAWNDNKGLGDTQYRDGYRIVGTEALAGYRWAFNPKISMSILLGGGRSKIEYQTRENHSGGATRSVHSARPSHLTSQADFIYVLPLDLKSVEFGLTGMLRLSALQPHAGSDEVKRTDWYINLPTPIPSVGVTLNVKM